MSTSSEGDTTAGHRPMLGPWLWLLIGQMCLWRPVTNFYLHRSMLAPWRDGFSAAFSHFDATTAIRYADTVLLFVAGLLLIFYRQRPAIWIMIVALWSVILLEWVRLWLYGPVYWTHLSFHLWLSWIGLVFSPVAWTAYLLESPVAAACFPKRDTAGKMTPRVRSPLPSAHGSRPHLHLLARVTELGLWIAIWVFWRVVWVPVLWGDLLLRLSSSGHLWPGDSIAAHHPWAFTLGLTITLGAAIGAVMLIFRRRRSTIMLVVILIWLLLLEGWAADIGIDIEERLFSSATRNLVVAINYLFWPLSWTAYFLESARVARLYPRGEATELTEGRIDVF